MSRLKKPLTFQYAVKSYLGFLEGRSKSDHTIKGYHSDLKTFENYLAEKTNKKTIQLKRVKLEDLERYSQWLKAKGYKINSRRRKLLTVRRLFAFLLRRNRLQSNASQHLPAPDKMERIPETIDIEMLIQKVKHLPQNESITARNRLMCWVLAETGCLVSELVTLRRSSLCSKPKHAVCFLQKDGQERFVPVSASLIKAAQDLEFLDKSPRSKNDAYLFWGFNRFGPMTIKMSERGVELCLARLAAVLGYPKLSPRLIRHSAVLHWLRQGRSQSEVQKMLGLKSDYAFKVYQPLLKNQENPV